MHQHREAQVALAQVALQMESVGLLFFINEAVT